MNRVIFILTLSAFLFSQQAEVTNIQAAQRRDGSQIVDITYDLLPDAIFEYFEVTVDVSLDGGQSWTSMDNVSGDLGDIIEAGNGKSLTWNYGQQFDETYSDQIKIRINATSNATIIDDSQEIPFEMVTVPSGEFIFGEGDLVQTIDYDYEIMKYPVTDYDYVLFMLDFDENTINSCFDVHVTDYGFDCATAVSIFAGAGGCDFGTLSEQCPVTCGICDQSGGEYIIDGSGMSGPYPGDANHPAGNYTYISFDNSKISWNGEIFEVEEGFVNNPVTGVSWFGAWAFATHYGMEVPNQYEWEKAARGNTGYDYPWGDDITMNDANYLYGNTRAVDTYNGENEIDLIYSSAIATEYNCPENIECEEIPDGSFIFFTEDNLTMAFYSGNQSWIDLDDFFNLLSFLIEEFNINWISDMASMLLEGESCYFPGVPESSGSATYYDVYGWFGTLEDFQLFENLPIMICEGAVSGSFYTNIEASPVAINGLDYGYEIFMPSQIITTNNSVSPYGLYDMAGNTWEMVMNNDGQLFTKGGAFNSSPGDLMSWKIISNNIPSPYVGFRCIRILND